MSTPNISTGCSPATESAPKLKHLCINCPMGKPLVSVLIPTKNRSDTAIECVRLAAMTGISEIVEVVVQDCSDNDLLEQRLVKEKIFDRVSYERTSPVSMVENWDGGLSRVTGQFVTIVGDDDAVYPSIVEVAKWAYSQGIKAVKQKHYDNYWWMGFYDKSLAGFFNYIPDHSGVAEIVEASPFLRRFSATGDSYGKFPMAYHNLIDNSVFQQIKSRTGRYFDGLSPDIYSGYAIGALLERFALIDFPFTVVGASKSSNSQRVKVGLANSHFSEFTGYKFSNLAPETPGLYASNADAMIKAFQNLGRNDLIEYIDFPRIYGRTILAEKANWRNHLVRYRETNNILGRSRLISDALLAFNMAGKLAKSILDKPRNAREANKTVREMVPCDSISIAVEKKMRIVADLGIRVAH